MALTDDVRAACARVAGRARQVRIVAEAIAPYARTLAPGPSPAPDLEPGAADEARAAYSLQLNADQLRLRLVPDAAQAAGLSRLPHRRGRACARARPVERGRARRRSTPREVAARVRARTPSTS